MGKKINKKTNDKYAELKMIKLISILCFMLLISISLTACDSKKDNISNENVEQQTEQLESETEQLDHNKELLSDESNQDLSILEAVQETEKETLPEKSTEAVTKVQSTEATIKSQPTEAVINVQATEATESTKSNQSEWIDLNRSNKLIVIDPGHQSRGNSQKEPIGPGSTQLKAKVASGTSGCVTGIPEYQLNLTVSLKLQQELVARGYEVIMIRTTNEVDISNAERAIIANNANADAFVRIHANGSSDSNVNGVMTLCQTASNPYNGGLFDRSYALSSQILDKVVATTGAKKQYVWKTDTMTGINWSSVPNTIVEMGYMSNPNEDQLMATDSYQNLIVNGIANGLDAYFASYK